MLSCIASHEEARARERTDHQVDTRKEIGRKSVGRVEIIQPYNSREREIGKESEKENKTEKR